MATLLEMAHAAADIEFVARVQAGASVKNMPYHPNLIMQVAKVVDLSGGPGLVSDDDILAALGPDPLEPGPPALPDETELEDANGN